MPPDPVAQAEERIRALEEENAVLRAVAAERNLLLEALQHAPAGVAVLEGAEHRFTFTNPAYLRFVRGKGEVLGRTVAEVFPELTDVVLPLLDAVYRTGETHRSEDTPFDLVLDGEERRLFVTYIYAPWYAAPDEVGGVIVVALDTTEEVTARQEARVSGATLQTLFDTVYDAVILHTPTGEIVNVNARMLAMFEVEREEAKRLRLIEDLFAPHAPIERLGAIWGPVLEGRPQLLEWPMKRPHDGSVFDAEVYLQKVHLYGQDLIMANLRDISERLTAEAERERLVSRIGQERARLEALVATLPAGVVFADPSGAIVISNPAMERMVGGPLTGDARGPADGYVLLQMDGTPFPQNELPLVRAIERGESSHGVPIRVRRYDGDQAIMEVHGAPVIDPEGAGVGAVAVALDITERVRAEEALRESEARFRSLFDESAAVMVLVDPASYTFVDCNRAAAAYYGYPREQLVGMPVHRINTLPEDELRARVAKARHRKQDRFRFQHRLASGEVREVEVFSGPLLVQGRVLLYSIVHDVTERIEVEAERERLLEEVRSWAAELDAANDELRRVHEEQEMYLQTISHDLRNPLNIMVGHAGLLQELVQELADGQRARFSIGAIQRSARRMQVMIEDLVDAARFEGGQLSLETRPLELHGWLENLLDRNAGVLEVGRVHPDVPADLPQIQADPYRLERVFTNLLSNALKYSDPDTPVFLRARRAGDAVEVALSDQGAGIAPEDLPHLFERFYRAAGGKAEGIGLGLFITRVLVEAHGGRIDVESTPGQGSTFRVTLPTSPAEAGPAPPP